MLFIFVSLFDRLSKIWKGEDLFYQSFLNNVTMCLSKKNYEQMILAQWKVANYHEFWAISGMQN